MKAFIVVAALAGASLSFGHPMGNFSVNHYARLEPGTNGLTVTYVLDLAELPTTELIQSWGVERDAPRLTMEAQARVQARRWAANLKVTENGKPLLGILESTELAAENGAANLPIFRIRQRIRFLAKGGRIEFADGNYPTRAGWREIVVRGADRASVGSGERSAELTLYPRDQEKAPPQDSAAWLEWRMPSPVASPPQITAVSPVASATAPAPAPEPLPGASQPVEPGHEYRMVALLVALAGMLSFARRRSRNRYPVA